MLELGLKSLIAYLLGSVMGALVIGAARGVDIRELGSGNAGGTNALRTQGLWFAAGTVLIDVGKGWLAAGIVPDLPIPGVPADASLDRAWLAVCCASAAVAGHVWPLYHGFRGGKGGATLAGALLALAPMVVAVAVAAWLVVAMLTGFASLATMSAAIAVPIAVRWLGFDSGALLAFGLCMLGLVVYAHRANLARLASRTEPRLGRLWLLRPRSSGK